MIVKVAVVLVLAQVGKVRPVRPDCAVLLDVLDKEREFVLYVHRHLSHALLCLVANRHGVRLLSLFVHSPMLSYLIVIV